MARPFEAKCSEAVHAPAHHMWLRQGPWPYSKCSKAVEV